MPGFKSLESPFCLQNQNLRLKNPYFTGGFLSNSTTYLGPTRGTPWHGDARLASPAGAPLNRVYFLARGEENQLLPQKSRESMARLFSSSFLPFYNSAGLEFTLSFFEGLVRAVPCFELRFLPDQRLFRFLEKLSEAG